MRRTKNETPAARTQTPPYVHVLAQSKLPDSRESLLPCRIPPPPGPPARTPHPTIAKPIPIRVPTFDLSAVKATKSTGGKAMKMPEKKPKKSTDTTMPPTLWTAMLESRMMPTTKAPNVVSA